MLGTRIVSRVAPRKAPLLAGAALVWAFGLGLVTGCAGPQVAGTVDAATLAKNAVVIVSVTHDIDTGVRGDPTFFVDREANAGMFEMRALHSREKVLGIPKRSDFDDVHGQVYVLDMPPGRHQIDGWSIYSAGARLWPNVAPTPLTFEARAGEAVYIGNLDMTHDLARNGFGIWIPVGGKPTVRDRSAIDIPIAEKRVPALTGKIAVRLLPLGEWKGESTQLNRVDPVLPIMPMPAKK